ncbi:hypothetical protein AMAG_20628 [Allomyces macrogynus ATCC 38327]|uniref:Uncharacterized protein n=1 Tax=Allomyces macrogynus (strain ATCC 38327) TaxID=578462 RepID=A0A0L0TCV0_ALLM3|nr:hypothetical protein AMAG_20628 [Allomyces macrogynus ATCC 38327]|eukprot:KNE72748.1 hypothetical protein AMAG_20628 [Allomyces macrogynus ATCC 38327]
MKRAVATVVSSIEFKCTVAYFIKALEDYQLEPFQQLLQQQDKRTLSDFEVTFDKENLWYQLFKRIYKEDPKLVWVRTTFAKMLSKEEHPEPATLAAEQ